MKKLLFICLISLIAFSSLRAQSGRTKVYSESSPSPNQIEEKEKANSKSAETKNDDDVIRIETDLIVIPAQISTADGKPVLDIKKEEFKIFENNVEQEIVYFSNQEQPFTVALVLDMSYSSLFRLEDIQKAALAFIEQLRENDKVMIVSFDEKARVLCDATNDKKALRLAVEATKIASGTSVYTALDLVIKEKFSQISGRKAIVLLSDGVDTSSQKKTAADILKEIGTSDALVYPIQYDTYEDVQKNRKNNAQILYDDNDRPYVVQLPKIKGEREEDYKNASEFLQQVSTQTGGRIYRVSSSTKLSQAFAKIADELRRIYSLGYYPSNERKNNVEYAVNVRIYRPNLKIRAKEKYLWQNKPEKTQ